MLVLAQLAWASKCTFLTFATHSKAIEFYITYILIDELLGLTGKGMGHEQQTKASGRES